VFVVSDPLYQPTQLDGSGPKIFQKFFCPGGPKTFPEIVTTTSSIYRARFALIIVRLGGAAFLYPALDGTEKGGGV